MNGCIDLISQELSYPQMAFKNTYGIQAINESQYKDAIDNFHRPQTGCLALILKCHFLANKFDPGAFGHDEEVNAACAEASDSCVAQVESQYDGSDRNYFDIAASWTSPYIPPYYLGYLSQPWVQAALGVPVNFTQRAQATGDAQNWTGVYARKDRGRGPLGDIGYLLDKGVKVALLYGDRDYSCNCKSGDLVAKPLSLSRWVLKLNHPGIGGENVSLAVNYSQAAAFRSAGYEDIKVNNSYVGGQVRQYGNFSFSRVYQAGAAVAMSQPETAFQIFQRAIFGLDIATGETNIGETPNYSSKGTPTTPQARQEVPAQPEPTCYVLDPTTCSDRAWGEVYYRSGVIHQYILIDKATAHLFPNIRIEGNQTTGKIGDGDGDDLGRGKRLIPDGSSPVESGSGTTSSALPNRGTRPLRGDLLPLIVVAGVGAGLLRIAATV